jgi:thymidylate synthase
MDGFGALAPCHTLFQFMVTDNGQGEKELNCMMYMSSSDVPLGRPYNIMQYSLLTMAMAHCLDYKLGKFTIVSCDTHIYANQMEKAKEQLMRTPKKDRAKVVFPADKKDLFAFEPEDFQILDYVSHERIDYPANK